MRKRLLSDTGSAPPTSDAEWLNIEDLVEVELSSEDVHHPIEAALLPGSNNGWRAAIPGRQTIRLLFAPARDLQRIRLRFVETAAERTQEYVLRCSTDGGQSFRDIVRQQWNFDPCGSTCETEEHRLDLPGTDVLELIITPNIRDDRTLASLAELRIA
ncbi:MAG: carbohydrate-binding protein [Candidatus Accumulibacter sp.]|uniref:carbohydrate-binding protein n=1 Tax=Accumulibacter sp. TaxID=2053492 RepID=UPI00287830FC|nr:carbohydrate-binding protein [Accumulibacter sp.]MDS4013958.1 carbohydrate-binding protein [Accumulibacter sp.]